MVHKGTFTYESEDQINIITVPSGVVIKDIYINITTEFNDSGTEVLDVGITGTADHYKNNLDVGSTGFTTAMDGNIPEKSGGTAITIQYDGQNNDANQGEGEIYIYYSIH